MASLFRCCAYACLHPASYPEVFCPVHWKRLSRSMRSRLGYVQGYAFRPRTSPEFCAFQSTVAEARDILLFREFPGVPVPPVADLVRADRVFSGFLWNWLRVG